MKKYLIIFLLFIITFAAIFFAWKLARRNPDFRYGPDRAAVIKQIESLSRFETASFSIDKIIEVSTDYDRLREFFFGDKIILVAHGKVIAGFDLSTLDSSNYSGSGDSIIIKLPAPEILETILDNNATSVFDRERGLFTKGELDLEATARQRAEDEIKQAACDGNILEEANINAKKQLSLLFEAAGFKEVTIITTSANCK
ncbi:MAG: DUF4230 domain-containing protein [Patescibacteria group bacterium]|nr:DUF4230 domain-containing protein [Patescibacteria group bacterium]MDD3778224.1 DUF4230 domain-containing protein [Patescibacteria group bacterium]MDD3939650.1 DUF4230 domain-containing protein [Patescibacteria group bacterium]MDD4444111.1 DUF4230 domain-containing protein [Patescibacteria group bacterium]